MEERRRRVDSIQLPTAFFSFLQLSTAFNSFLQHSTTAFYNFLQLSTAFYSIKPENVRVEDQRRRSKVDKLPLARPKYDFSEFFQLLVEDFVLESKFTALDTTKSFINPENKHVQTSCGRSEEEEQSILCSSSSDLPHAYFQV